MPCRPQPGVTRGEPALPPWLGAVATVSGCLKRRTAAAWNKAPAVIIPYHHFSSSAAFFLVLL